MSGICDDTRSKSALLQFKLSTSVLSSGVREKNVMTLSLASFQLFGDSSNICSVLRYLDHKSNSFFSVPLHPYYPLLFSELFPAEQHPSDA